MAVTTVFMTAVIVVFSLLSIRRVSVFQDELALWQDTAIHQPHAPLVQTNLGTVLARRGRPQEAIEHFEQVLRLDPNHSHAHYNLARALAEVGRSREALPHYEQAVRSTPGFADAHYNFGLALCEAGRTREAIEQFEAALRSRPDFAAAHNNLGATLAGSGRTTEAIGHFEQALSLEPDVEGCANLAFAYALVQRCDDAIATAQRAVELARSQGKTALATELEAWLSSYRDRAREAVSQPVRPLESSRE